MTTPKLRFDLVSLDTSDQPVLAYAYPKGDVSVPITSMMLLSFSGFLDLDECVIWIKVGAQDEAIAFELGGVPEFKSGWAGTYGSRNLWMSVGYAVNNNLDIVIDKELDWPEQTKVIVRYYCGFGDGKHVEGSYEFETMDYGYPFLQRVIVEDMRRVTLECTKDVVAGTAEISSDDGFVPAIKSIVPSNQSLIVTLVEELSFSSTYTIACQVSRNGVDYWNDEATFETDDYPVKAQAPGRMPQHWMEQDREQDGLLDKLCDLANEMFGLAHKDIVYSLSLWDVDLAYDNHVRNELKSLGYDFLTTFISDRKALSVLFDIYRRKGVRAHLPGIVYTLIGIQPVIKEAWDGVWIMGESVLGVDTVLGDGSDESEVTFRVIFSRALTDHERRTVQRVLDFAKPSNTLYRIVEPSPPAAPVWIMGESILGIDTILG